VHARSAVHRETIMETSFGTYLGVPVVVGEFTSEVRFVLMST